MIKSFYSSLMAQRAVDVDGATTKPRSGVLSVKFLVKLAVSLGILCLLFVFLPTEKLLGAIASVSWVTWLLVILGYILGHIISALKWKLMLRATGTLVASGTAIRAHGAGLFANLCLPSIVGGDFIRAALVVREQRSNLAAITLGSLADRLNDILALVIIAACASLWVPAASKTYAVDLLSYFAIALMFATVAGIVVARAIPQSWVPGPFKKLLAKVNDALDTLFRSPLTAVCCLALSIIIQASFVGLNVFIANAMDIPAAAVVWFFAWPMAKLVALAPISLGGIGVREVAIAGILAPFGVEASLAVAQSLCWEVVLIFSGLLSGLAVALVPSRPAPLVANSR